MLETNLGTLLELFHKLIANHQKLLEVIETEKKALSDADLQQIQRMTYEKEVLVETIRLVESQRIQITDAIEQNLGVMTGTLRISEIISMVNDRHPAQAGQLISAFESLVDLIESLSEKNRSNRMFIEKSLQHLNQMRGNVLSEAGVRSDTYTQKGQKKQGGTATRLISKEA